MSNRNNYENEEKNRRNYYRKCGICGERHEQHEMERDYSSPNGWICYDCIITLHPEYEE